LVDTPIQGDAESLQIKSLIFGQAFLNENNVLMVLGSRAHATMAAKCSIIAALADVIRAQP
jgi:hypothetical protein